MKITNKEALQAMKTIKTYCGEQGCDNCCFLNGDDTCIFETGWFPHVWEAPALSRWTKTDKALAEALKAAGVEKVMRFEATGVLVLSTAHKAIVDHFGIIEAFQRLRHGEEISLDVIINSEGERADE